MSLMLEIPFGAVEILLNEEVWWILPERAMFRPTYSSLYIADPHVGKATHFRKQGIPISDDVFMQDLYCLDGLVKQLHVRELIILGDFFHSDVNTEWERFQEWLMESTLQHCLLVPGNHDRWTRSIQGCEKFEVCSEVFEHHGIECVHDAAIDTDRELLRLSGHIHPGIVLRSKGRQALKLPCLWQHGRTFVLPAFSKFSGLAEVGVNKGNRVWAFSGKEVIECRVA